jgi:hypothetical protein
MMYASRADHLKAEGAYEVLARAQALEAQGREIIHLRSDDRRGGRRSCPFSGQSSGWLPF